MPIYEYECLNCGNKLEVIQKFKDKPLETCPQCNGRLHKLISQSSFILKGNGWYVTDYARTDKKKEAASHGKTTPSKETEKSASKTDSKPKAEVAARH
jgi:putative FmdB family regulatory protein